MLRLAAVALMLSGLLSAGDKLSFDYELDPYYSNTSLFFQIGEEPVIDATDVPEERLYTQLMLDSWKPNTLIVEAAVHPMAVAGMAYRNAFPDAYDNARIDTLGINIVESMTAGFEEPYALSLFLGRMVTFERGSKQGHIGSNRAYSGYLLSVGDYSIKDNRAIYNPWCEIEAKLKGTRDLDGRLLDWSFRVGTKVNANPDIADSIYIGARRSRIDFFEAFWSWFYNGGFDVSVAVTADSFELMQVEALFEKKWPLEIGEKVTLGLEFGYIYESNEKYRGALYEEGINNHRLILRPNLTF